MEYEAYDNRKLCPFRLNNLPPADQCIGGKCGWWCDFAQDCAVPLIAGMFADSDFCSPALGESGL